MAKPGASSPGPPANSRRGPHPPGHRPVRQMFHPPALPSSPDATQRPFANRRYDRPPYRQMTASAVSRTGRYGVGWPGRWRRSWHACAPARPPGWRRRGCRRPPRTARTARSRRSATTRPHQAGPVRSRHGGLLRPARRTGASCFAGRGRCARARTARVVPPTAAGQPGWPCTSSACPRRGAGTPRPGKVLYRGCSGASSLTSSKMSASRASPSSRTRRAVMLSSGVGRFLTGRHITTVGQNHRSPGGLSGGCPSPAGTAQRRRPLVTLRRCPVSCVTHVNRRSVCRWRRAVWRAGRSVAGVMVRLDWRCEQQEGDVVMAPPAYCGGWPGTRRGRGGCGRAGGGRGGRCGGVTVCPSLLRGAGRPALLARPAGARAVLAVRSQPTGAVRRTAAR